MNQDKIGKFINTLRTERKLSQYQLADMIPITRQAVSKWERGESIPDSSTLLRLSEIFNVTINELLNGERLKDNSIETLESTTLSIFDESNKKSRKIKRNFKISITIITILLLTFLSYYFINSYNTIKVYKVSGSSENFDTHNGILIKTNSKTYLRIGKLKHSSTINVENMKLYYIKYNKKYLMIEDRDLTELDITDFNGYNEKFSNDDIKYILENSYLEITYDENQKEVIKLNFQRDFVNNNLINDKNTELSIKEKYKKQEVQAVLKEEPIEEKKEEIKESTPPTYVNNQPTIIVPAVTEEPRVEAPPKEEQPTPIENEETPPQENIITPEMMVDKIKELGMYFSGSYIYETDDEVMIFIYYENPEEITVYKNDELMWEYVFNTDRYNCSPEYSDNCTASIEETIEQYLK